MISHFEQFVLLLIACQGILLSLVLIITAVKKKESNFFLGLIILVIALEILNAFAMSVNYHNTDHPFPFWTLGSYWILPASLFGFIRINTQIVFHRKPIIAFAYIPACIEIGMEFYAFYTPTFPETGHRLIEHMFWYIFTEVLPVVMMLIVLIHFFKRLKTLALKLKKAPKHKYKLHLSKLYGLLILFSVITVLWFVQGILSMEVYMFIEIILSLLIFVLGYVVYFQPAFFEVPDIYRTFKNLDQEFLRYDDQQELKRLASLFEDEKVYLQPKLSVNDLAVVLKLPPRYLSGLINSYHRTNFSNYVNSYRVKHFLERVKHPDEKHKTLLAIALESGFNSKSSFNHIVKRFTGKSPSDFLEK